MLTSSLFPIKWGGGLYRTFLVTFTQSDELTISRQVSYLGKWNLETLIRGNKYALKLSFFQTNFQKMTTCHHHHLSARQSKLKTYEKKIFLIFLVGNLNFLSISISPKHHNQQGWDILFKVWWFISLYVKSFQMMMMMIHYAIACS